VWFSF
jgi:hypothetical protein